MGIISRPILKCGFLKASVIFCIITLFVSAILGCTSFPKPSEEKNSMLIVYEHPAVKGANEELNALETREIILSGPNIQEVSVPVSGKTQKCTYVSLVPGRYTYQGSGTGSSSHIEIPANSVFLLQEKFVGDLDESELPLSASITPEDRRWVSEEVRNYINFYDWYGKDFIGFGPYVPRFTMDETVYELRLLSEPSGAGVTIDGQEWGKTPLTADIEKGKHLVLLEKDGFQSVQTYVTVEGREVYTTELKRVEETAKGTGKGEQGKSIKDTYSMIVFPFQNLGSSDRDNLSTVFSDGIISSLYDRKNIRLIEDYGNLSARKRRVEDEFTQAERTGAELVISGMYAEKQDSLLVSAALYDVRSEQVKTSIAYTGKSGLAMFDSIDEMTEDFLSNVDKVLPAVGKEVIEREQVVTREMVEFQSKASGKQIVSKRHEKKHTLSILSGIGAQAMGDGNSDWTDTGTGLGVLVLAQYQWEFLMPLGLITRIGYQIPKGIEGNSSIINAQIGPSVTFAGRINDVSLSLMPFLSYIFPFQAGYYDNDTGEFVPEGGMVGPLFSAGLVFDSHVKLYLARRLDRIQSYFLFGMYFELLQKKFEIGSERTGKVPLGGMLYAGLGVRL